MLEKEKLINRYGCIPIPHYVAHEVSVSKVCVWIDFLLFAKNNNATLLLNDTILNEQEVKFGELKHKNKLYENVINFKDAKIGGIKMIESLNSIAVDDEAILEKYFVHVSKKKDKIAFLNID